MKTQFCLQMRFVAILVLTLATSALYQNCGQVAFTATPFGGLNGFGGVPVSNPGAPGTGASIRQYKPALAVRDISCLACHANIQANVVTDFGYGNSWYMNAGQDPGVYGQTHYVPVTWQSLEEVRGQIIVPDIIVPQATVKTGIPQGSNMPMTSVSLLNFLTMTNLIDYSTEWTFKHWGIVEPSNLSLTAHVTPPAGLPAVTSQSYVYIGAPTSTEILKLVTNTGPAPWIEEVGNSQDAVAQFSKVSGENHTSYFMNTGAITCSGQDIVVNGTLVLNYLQIYAENGGCRLYVNGPVFIEGTITYLNSTTALDPTNNLQITSSQAIVMGAGRDEIYMRLIGDIRNNLLLRSASNASDYSHFANAIVNEAKNIGSAILIDASNPGNLPTALSAGKNVRAKIDFNHLLLNAPVIESRYLGTISGVIVAETVQSSLGSFSFNYDPIFEKVQILPALPNDILCVGASSATCNPAQP